MKRVKSKGKNGGLLMLRKWETKVVEFVRCCYEVNTDERKKGHNEVN